MNCMLCLIEEHVQENLRNLSHLQEDRFEKVIEAYKINFISEFFLTKDENLCEKHRDFENFKKILCSINIKKVEVFFDTIKAVYIDWINGCGEKSIAQLADLMDEHRILDSKFDISKELLFRGRVVRNDILSNYDMFHIPFHKRYLISNQRFSLTGQPILYFGYNLHDIVRELRINSDNLEDVYVSLFTFKKNEPFDVFDLRNNFSLYFSEIIETSNFIEEPSIVENLSNDQFIRSFYTSLLSSLCLFKKRHEKNSFTFCEEYVLPQLVSQVVKGKNLNGIIYPSTKLSTTNSADNTTFSSRSKYRENIAIFTNFNPERHYDVDLFEKFNISIPRSINNSEKIDLDKLEKLCDSTRIAIKKSGISSDNYHYTDSYQEFKKEYASLKIPINENKEKEYIEHPLGKLHTFCLYEFLLEMRNQIIFNKQGGNYR